MFSLEKSLDHISRRRAKAPTDAAPAPQVLVRSPNFDFEYGDLSRRYHCASVEKVMVAAAVFALAERGTINLDAALSTVLPPADFAGFRAAPGFDVGRDVTVDHLLSHSSGITDYFIASRRGRVPTSLREVTAHTQRKWTRSEILEVAKSLEPSGKPGEKFHYSDTAYLLLGRVLEEAMGESYATILDHLVFAPCGMSDTESFWHDSLTESDVAALDIVPIWFDRTEMSHTMALSVGWDSVITTARDLLRFQTSLHSGALLTAESLERMSRPRNRMRPGIHYGTGMATLQFDEFVPFGFTHLPRPTGGIGLSASHMFYYPNQDAHVIMNFHSTKEMSRSFRVHMRIAGMLAKAD